MEDVQVIYLTEENVSIIAKGMNVTEESVRVLLKEDIAADKIRAFIIISDKTGDTFRPF